MFLLLNKINVFCWLLSRLCLSKWQTAFELPGGIMKEWSSSRGWPPSLSLQRPQKALDSPSAFKSATLELLMKSRRWQLCKIRFFLCFFFIVHRIAASSAAWCHSHQSGNTNDLSPLSLSLSLLYRLPEDSSSFLFDSAYKMNCLHPYTDCKGRQV